MPEKIELYSHAAVFCCPSIYEPFGIINLEAMACETAVVASAVGGIKEVVVRGRDGLPRAAGADEREPVRGDASGSVFPRPRRADQRADGRSGDARAHWQGGPQARGGEASAGRRSRGRCRRFTGGSPAQGAGPDFLRRWISVGGKHGGALRLDAAQSRVFPCRHSHRLRPLRQRGFHSG